MGADSKIEWTDATWNPVVGCSVVSPGCKRCYAMRLARRLELMGQPIYQGLTKATKAGAVWTGKVELSNHGQVIKPLSWKKPRRIFVNSMSDLFHENLPDEAIDQVFAVMALAPRHTFQVLTKRAARMRKYMLTPGVVARISMRMCDLDHSNDGTPILEGVPSNIWLGVSVENQEAADERIPELLSTPAAVRFLSCEPLLGPVSLSRVNVPGGWQDVLKGWRHCPEYGGRENTIDWVICGGESGPGARPMHPAWARSLRDQCQAARVPFFFKQWGEQEPYEVVRRGKDGEIWRRRQNGEEVWFFDEVGKAMDTVEPERMVRVGKKAAGRLLDGRTWDEFPKVPA